MTKLKIRLIPFFRGLKQLVWDFKQLFSLLLGCLLSLSLSASGNDTPLNSIFDLMNHREVLNLALETDFGRLKADRSNEEYQPASLSFKDATGTEQVWKIKVKLRGKFRRMTCTDVPPLKLNFKKSELEAAGLATFDDLKLVPQCVDDPELAADYIKREYLAYRMYNEVSPYSYRVQFLRITYLDSVTGNRKKQWAFLIEDTAQLKARLKANKCDGCYNLPPERFHTQATRLVSVYQYLIGNTDWSLQKNKNVKFLEVNGKIVPVPYDFDFSGLVNTNYASPDPALGLTYRRERIYLGFPDGADELKTAIHIVVANRDKFEDLVESFRFLSPESRADMLGYLNSFLGKPAIVNFQTEPVATRTVEAEK